MFLVPNIFSRANFFSPHSVAKRHTAAASSILWPSSKKTKEDNRTAQVAEVHQGDNVGTSGVENGADRDSMLATDDAEADEENTVPP